ncbi:2-hydroxychromene-2-carboxylate isomerase [Pseudoteredinibacter isoporae]|uniref:2-hydroxychromene-2-carboxylate isomerase n=1 Tax=Pseudoteredinibacter isoporae TaxID=570281 RepID=UPI0031025620
MNAIFYFDYISPYAYIGWQKLPELAQKTGLHIEPVPVLFAGLLRAYGQIGPAEHPAKQKWMQKNIARKCEEMGITIRAPQFHPFNPLLGLRIAAQESDTQQRYAIIDALMKAVWQEQKHISEEQDVFTALDEAGLDAPALIKQGLEKSASEQLKQNTADAIAKGAFGVPTIVIGEDLFFGQDDYRYIELLLDNKDPSKSEPAQQWLSSEWQASSMRKEMKQ